MKRVSGSLSRLFPPITLYRDDVLQIVKEFESYGQRVTVTVGQNELEDLSELCPDSLRRDRVGQLGIVVHSPHAALNLSPSAVHLYVGDDDAKAVGLFTLVSDILKRHRRPLWWASAFWFLLLLSVFVGAAFAIGRLAGPVGLVAGAVVVVAYALWFYLSYTREMRTHAIVVLVDRRSAPPFLKRNRDAIVLAVFSAVVGACVLVLVEYLLAHWL